LQPSTIRGVENALSKVVRQKKEKMALNIYVKGIVSREERKKYFLVVFPDHSLLRRRSRTPEELLFCATSAEAAPA
jgi:hypothetical protein